MAAQDVAKPGTALSSQPEEEERSGCGWTHKFYLSVGIFIIVVIACTGVLMYVGWSSFVDFLFDAVEAREYKVAQALVINGILVLLTVCCLPGPALCIMLDGFFFGFFMGLALALASEVIAFLIAVSLARSCCKSHIRQWLFENEQLSEVLNVLEEDPSGKFLVLFRFVTLPGWLKNYSMGMLDINLLKLVLVFLPGTAFYDAIFVYIGSKGHEVTSHLRKGNTDKALSSVSGVEVVIFCLSILALVLIIALGWREYRVRREAISGGAAQGESAPLLEAKKASV